MQEILEKLIIVFLIIVIIVLGYVFFLQKNSEIGESKVNAKILSEINEKKLKFIENGINWLADNKDNVDANDIAVHFIYFYKVTSEPNLADKFSKLAKEKSADIKILDTNFDEKNSKYLNWENLKFIYYSLERKKCKNEDYQKDLDKFKKYFVKNKAKIIPDSMSSSRRVSNYYLLREMGVDQDNSYEKTIKEIQNINPNPTSKNYIDDLYSFTHIIFTKSDYYSKYLNPADYQKEVNVFEEAIRYFNKNDMNDERLDIASEVVISMKLLGKTQGKDFESLWQKILEHQNEDGSFGSGNKQNDSVKIHNTAVALLALIDFTQNFRQAKNYCFY